MDYLGLHARRDRCQPGHLWHGARVKGYLPTLFYCPNHNTPAVCSAVCTLAGRICLVKY